MLLFMTALNNLSKWRNFGSLRADSYFRDTNRQVSFVVLWQAKKKKKTPENKSAAS